MLEDADLELAASNVVKGGFSYSGQRCTAVKLVLAMESIADELVKKVRPILRSPSCGSLCCPHERLPAFLYCLADPQVRSCWATGGPAMSAGSRDLSLLVAPNSQASAHHLDAIQRYSAPFQTGPMR